MVTIKQLARELSLSTATVSMALRGSQLISDATRARVLELAERRHYVPNNFGRGLQSRRSRMIGYLLSSVTESFSNELFESSGYTAAAHGYGMLTGMVGHGDVDGLRRQLMLLLEKNVDGFLFRLRPCDLEPLRPLLATHRKPFVFCSEHAPGDCNIVVNDDTLGGRLAVSCLARLGHREIALSSTMLPRFEGYRSQAAAENMTTRIFRDAGEAVPLLEAFPGVTAAVCYSDHQAIEVKRRIRASGRRVPEDVSIIGFDDMWFAGLPEFDLATIAQQRSEIGRQAVERLLEIIDGDTEIRHIYLEPYLVERGSVAPPRG